MDPIDRQAAVDALWKALYEYEDKTEKQFQESEDLDVGDWILHRCFVQDMSDIDRQTILNLPSAQPKVKCIAEIKISKEDMEELVEEIKAAQSEIVPQFTVTDGEPQEFVPVVRCKDCRWGREVCGNIKCFVDINVPPEYHGYEWYCPNGERREE